LQLFPSSAYFPVNPSRIPSGTLAPSPDPRFLQGQTSSRTLSLDSVGSPRTASRVFPGQDIPPVSVEAPLDPPSSCNWLFFFFFFFYAVFGGT